MSSEVSNVSKGFKGSETCQGWPPWANGVMPRHQDLDPGIPRAVNAVESVAEVGKITRVCSVLKWTLGWKSGKPCLLCMHACCIKGCCLKGCV